MKDRPRSFRSLRSVIYLLIAFVLPMVSTQCRSTSGTYKDIEYDAGTLNTPPGHNLEKKDYPFDDQGNYRKDWVKSKARGKTRSATGAPPTPPAASSTGATEIASTSPATGGQYYGPAGASGAPTAAAPSSPPPAAQPASPTYHKVESGDTLFSLAGRYQTSVDDLKRVNGLSSDTIRLGQSLRIP